MAVASLVGFIGNEAVAVFRIRVGSRIGSAALVADGYHAMTDGWTSLAVLSGAVGVWLGFLLADTIVGLIIAAAILVIVWQSGKTVFTRLLDRVDPQVIKEIRQAAYHVPGVEDVAEVRARWLGHELHAEVNVAVDPELSVAEGHDIAREVNHQLLHRLTLQRNGFHALPVVDSDVTVAGILSSQDLAANLKGSMPIGSVMTSKVYIIPHYNDIHHAARLIARPQDPSRRRNAGEEGGRGTEFFRSAEAGGAAPVRHEGRPHPLQKRGPSPVASPAERSRDRTLHSL